MSKYNTTGGMATQADTFTKLLHHIRECQDQSAMMSHLTGLQGNAKDAELSKAWLMMSEMFKQIADRTTYLAQGRLQ